MRELIHEIDAVNSESPQRRGASRAVAWAQRADGKEDQPDRPSLARPSSRA